MALANFLADIDARFGLNGQAEALLRRLLDLIKASPDELSGFLAGLKTRGFGATAATWLGDGAAAALSGAETNNALGAGAVAEIARGANIEPDAAAAAIGYALPKLIGLLTPGGTVPRALPASLTALDAAPRLAPELARPRQTEVRALSSAGPWAAPLMVLAALTAGTYFYSRLKGGNDAAPPAEKAEAPSPPVAAPEQGAAVTPPAAPATPAWLKLEQANGVLAVSGSVDSAGSRDAILTLLKSQFGAAPISGDVAVDPSVGPSGWLSKLKPALDLFTAPAWRAAFDGGAIDVKAPAADRQKIVAGLQAIYGSTLTVAGSDLPSPAPAPAPGPADQTAAALAGLKPGFKEAELATILNKYVIDFETGSAAIPDVSKPILRQAAALIKRLPDGVKVHIDGYTDATGDPAANLVLSRRRAESVRAFLVESGVPAAELRAKGHGAARGGEGENRADRRIEFSVR